MGNTKENHSDIEKLSQYYKALLQGIGEEPEREGLQRTPIRAAKALLYLTQGYHMDLDTIINGAIFHENSTNMVVVKNIEFYSLCEHHLMPFWGICHIAYIPDGKIIGLSKLARIVDLFARRLQVQERLTEQIGAAVEQVLVPKGVGVIIEAQHMCMMMRGVEKRESKTVTCTMKGTFSESETFRTSFENKIQI